MADRDKVSQGQGEAAGAMASPGGSAKGRTWAETARSILSFGGASPSSSPVDSSSVTGMEGSGRAIPQRPLEGVRLKLVGGSRNQEDEARIDLLASLAAQLGISGRVDFCVNIPFRSVASCSPPCAPPIAQGGPFLARPVC